jgi:uncharacterized membrane protein
MTLLVLNIAIPSAGAVRTEGDLWNALADLGPSLLTYLMSFLTLGIFWIGQQAQIGRLQRSDRHLTWIHLAFLIFVTLVPFTTALLSRFLDYRPAVLVYWLNIFCLGLVLLLALTYAKRAGYFGEDAEAAEAVAAMSRRIYIAQALYGGATVLCLVSPYLSVALIVLVQLNYVIAPNIPLLRKL